MENNNSSIKTSADVKSHSINRENKTWEVTYKDGSKETGKYKLTIIQNTSLLTVLADCDAKDPYINSLICTDIAKVIADEVKKNHGTA